MFLKVSKKPINERCQMKKSREFKMIRIGTAYSLYLAENRRSESGISQKTIVGLGNYNLREVEPVYVGQGTTGLGTVCRQVYVNSFNLEDPTSFRKVEPDPPVRFYHSFRRQLKDAATEHDISLENLRKYTALVLAVIPLYDYSGYCAYVKDELKNRIRGYIKKARHTWTRCLIKPLFSIYMIMYCFTTGFLYPVNII